MALSFASVDKIFTIDASNKRIDSKDPKYRGFFNAVTSIELEIRYISQANFTITVSPEIQDGLVALESGLVGIGLRSPRQPDASSAPQTPFESLKSTLSTVSIQLILPGEEIRKGMPAKTPFFVGYIMQPDLSTNGGTLDITLRGTGFSSILNATDSALSVDSNAKEIIDKIGKDAGLEIVYGDLDNRDDPAVIKALTSVKVKEDFINSPFQVIDVLCRRANCFFIDGISDSQNASDKRYLFIKSASQQSLFAQKPKYTFVLYRNPNPANAEIPIFDYSLQSGRQLFIAGYAFGGKSVAYNPLERSKEEQRTANENAPTPKAGAQEQYEGKRSPGLVQGENSTLLENQRDADVFATFGLQFTLTVPPVPDILPLQVINVIFGDKVKGLSGKALITRVRHRLNASVGWETELECRMTAALTEPEKSPVQEIKGTAESRVEIKAKSVFP
jgi:hypothetical protein